MVCASVSNIVDTIVLVDSSLCIDGGSWQRNSTPVSKVAIALRQSKIRVHREQILGRPAGMYVVSPRPEESPAITGGRQ